MTIKQIIRYLPQGWEMSTLNDMGVVNIDINSWDAMGNKNFTVLMKDKNGKFHSKALSVRWDKDHMKPLAGLIKEMVLSVNKAVGNANTSVE